MCAVILMMFLFRESYNLAAAYGLAVSGTMTITGIFIIWIYLKRNQYWRMLLGIGILAIDAVFLASNIFKIPHGGTGRFSSLQSRSVLFSFTCMGNAGWESG